METSTMESVSEVSEEILQQSIELLSEEEEISLIHNNINNDRFHCANCSMIDLQIRKVTDFIFCDPIEGGEQLKMTVLQAISAIFNIKLEPFLMSCYEDLKLCSVCGINLAALYRCFKQFTQISSSDSIISTLLKLGGGNNVELSNKTKKSLRKNPKRMTFYATEKNLPKNKLNNKKNWITRGCKIKTGKYLRRIIQEQTGRNKNEDYGGQSSAYESNSIFSTSDHQDELPKIRQEVMTRTLNKPYIQSSESIILKNQKGMSNEETGMIVTNFLESNQMDKTELNITITSEGLYHCLNCGRVFSKKAAVILHLGFKHKISKENAQNQCKHPSILEKINSFKKPEDILVRKKPRKPRPKQNRIPFPCPHCHKTSWSHRDLSKHVSSVHLKIRPFSCPICNKTFSQKQQVDAHLKVHKQEKTSLCYLCGKSYSSAGALKGHLERHFPNSSVPPKPNAFKCNLCNVACSDQRRLNEHKLRHQDERNFPCDQCEKTFKTRRDLVKHRNYHKLRLEKPEKCPSCDKRYATKEILKFHLYSTHHYSLEDARSAAGIGLAAVAVYDQQNLG